MMSFQTGEPLRRIRARMIKSGMMDNLEAQLRERKAVDHVIGKVSFKDVDREPFAENDVATAAIAICGNITTTDVSDEEGDDYGGEDDSGGWSGPKTGSLVLVSYSLGDNRLTKVCELGYNERISDCY